MHHQPVIGKCKNNETDTGTKRKQEYIQTQHGSAVVVWVLPISCSPVVESNTPLVRFFNGKCKEGWLFGWCNTFPLKREIKFVRFN